MPLGRLATAEEVAVAVLFLAGPQSRYATGTILHLDGGLFLPWWSNRHTGELWPADDFDGPAAGDSC